MTTTPGDLPDANEADAIEQAQAADGHLDDTSGELAVERQGDVAAERWDADEADVLDQANTIKPDGSEDYPVDND